MKNKHDVIWPEIRAILEDILIHIQPQHKNYDNILNERYLHHYFSHRYQQQFPGADLVGVNGITQQKYGEEISLHPEWPTYKKASNHVNGAKYSNDEPVDIEGKGSTAHIDFAVGRYLKPWLGIEFKLTTGWPTEGVAFDLVKLLDNRNGFKQIISFNILIRNKLSNKHEGIKTAIKDSYKDAVRKLENNKKNYLGHPALTYIVAEVAKDKRRVFIYQSGMNIDSLKETDSSETQSLSDFLKSEWK